MESQYKMSICMMVKDEEKNIERCLESLKILTETNYVELIIVDTGSEDRTVELCEKYTDKIYFHPWNNSFSEMRNITISYAKGEWIFIIDADEELREPEKVLALINSSEIDNYNTIKIRASSLPSLDALSNKLPDCVNTERFFRNDGEFQFVGRIHNQPLSKQPVLFKEDIYLIHYGYVTDDKELMDKKFKRTYTLLKEELDRDPDNVYYQYQLAVSYNMHGDYKEAWREIQKAYNLLKNKSDADKRSALYVYNKYVIFGYREDAFEDIIKVCKEGIALRNDFIDLYQILAFTYDKLGNRDEAIENYLNYISLMEHYDELDITKDKSIILHSTNEPTVVNVHHNLAVHLRDKGQYNLALEHARKITGRDNEKVVLILGILVKAQKYKELKKYYDSLSNLKVLFIETLENEKKYISIEDIKIIEREFVYGEDDYAILNKIRIADDGIIKEILLEEFLKDFNYNSDNVPFYYLDLFKEAENSDELIINAFKNIKSYFLKLHIKYLIDKYSNIKEKLINYLLSVQDISEDFQTIRVYLAIANVVLLNEIEIAKREEKNLDSIYEEICKLYIQNGMNYINYLYNPKALNEAYKTIDNDEEKFFMLMFLAKEAVNNDEIKLSIYHFKEAINVYPYVVVAINKYKEEFFSKIQY